MVGGDDAGAIRENFDRVFERPEFDYSPSLLDRLGSWLARLVERLLEMLRLPGAGAPGGTGVWSYVILLVLIVMVIGAVFLIVRRLRHRRPDRSTRDRRSVTVKVTTGDGGHNWMDDYLDAGGHDAAKIGVLTAYRNLVADLGEHGVLHESVGDSPRELVAALDDPTPPTSTLMAEASDIFEGPWYAQRPADPDDQRRLDAIAHQILDGQDH